MLPLKHSFHEFCDIFLQEFLRHHQDWQELIESEYK